jgi:hypothetical protein
MWRFKDGSWNRIRLIFQVRHRHTAELLVIVPASRDLAENSTVQQQVKHYLLSGLSQEEEQLRPGLLLENKHMVVWVQREKTRNIAIARG